MSINDVSRINKLILAELKETLGKINKGDIYKLIDAIKTTKRIFITGYGRSGLVMKCFAMRLMHMGLNTYVVGDVTTPSINEGDLIIIGSGSGETKNAINITKIAKSNNAKVGLLTTKPNSPIANLADIIILVSAPSIKTYQSSQITSQQPMGTLFEQSLLLLTDGIIINLMMDFCIDENMMITRHANLE